MVFEEAVCFKVDKDHTARFMIFPNSYYRGLRHRSVLSDEVAMSFWNGIDLMTIPSEVQFI